jgi:hypothetical protein
MLDIDMGDFLTFASIADALGLEYDGPHFRDCEVEPGLWRRHPELGDHSRSDISRDGYMGVLFNALVTQDDQIHKRMIEAGWRRCWTMGDRGNLDYINIWPLVPVLYAMNDNRTPTIPTLCTSFNDDGFRSHLLALIILIERLIGKDRWSHRQGSRGIYYANRHNAWFEELYRLCHGLPPGRAKPFEYHWGGCPYDLFVALTEFTAEQVR